MRRRSRPHSRHWHGWEKGQRRARRLPPGLSRRMRSPPTPAPEADVAASRHHRSGARGREGCPVHGVWRNGLCLRAPDLADGINQRCGDVRGFLEHLAAAWPTGRVLVVLDNAGYHKGHVARQWWAAHRDRIRPLWLPPYSPELNLIERVWRHLKDKLSNHRWWADLSALERASGILLDR